MSAAAPDPRSAGVRLTVRDRFVAWLFTGPVGRIAAFWADVAVAWWRWARGREHERRTR